MVSELTFGYSPCPNDTFMFNAIAQGTTGIDGHRFEPVLHDVETLNRLSMDAVLDISKVSFYEYLKIKENYRLLASGGALGFGCGPVLISRRSFIEADISRCRVDFRGDGPWPTCCSGYGRRMPGTSHLQLMTVFSMHWQWIGPTAA